MSADEFVGAAARYADGAASGSVDLVASVVVVILAVAILAYGLLALD